MPGMRVDGQRVLEVREAVLEGVARARKGDGPSLIEAMTYRYRGHSRSDPRIYRTKEEEAYWHERDPIKLFKADLVAGGVMTEKSFAALQAEVDKAIAEAEKFAVEECVRGLGRGPARPRANRVTDSISPPAVGVSLHAKRGGRSGAGTSPKR
jgi:TPP-dependent pyruvate/acetoin dehydrogenase alpha subunit